MMVTKHPEVITAHHWKNRTRGGYSPVIKLANEILFEGFARENFYLTASRKGVPLLIIKDNTHWMSVTYFGKLQKYRLFTDYVPNGKILRKISPELLPKQKRVDFSSLDEAKDFILNKGWEKL